MKTYSAKGIRIQSTDDTLELLSDNSSIYIRANDKLEVVVNNYPMFTVTATGNVMLGNKSGNAGDVIMSNGVDSHCEWKSPDAMIGNAYVKTAGATMTGALILNSDPTTDLGATTKKYVDTLSNTKADKTAVETLSSTVTSNKTTSDTAITKLQKDLADGLAAAANQKSIQDALALKEDKTVVADINVKVTTLEAGALISAGHEIEQDTAIASRALKTELVVETTRAKEAEKTLTDNLGTLQKQLDTLNVTGQFVGAADTFATLPSGTTIGVSDWAVLRVDDGTHIAGGYLWDGTVWVFTFRLDADFTTVLAAKADKITVTALSTTVDGKADKKYVDDELAKKSDKTTVTALTTTVTDNKTSTDTAITKLTKDLADGLAAAGDKTSIDTALAKKVNISDKAVKTDFTGKLADKWIDAKLLEEILTELLAKKLNKDEVPQMQNLFLTKTALGSTTPLYPTDQEVKAYLLANTINNKLITYTGTDSDTDNVTHVWSMDSNNKFIPYKTSLPGANSVVSLAEGSKVTLTGDNTVNVDSTKAFAHPSFTDVITTKVASTKTASVTLVDANPSRRSFMIQNDTPYTLYIKYGENVTKDDYTFKISTLNYYESYPTGCYVGKISGIWDTTVTTLSGHAIVTEMK